ncbi:MAG: SulP family inorganic anion transporter [Verrucomicrobiota bacterium]
MVAGLTLAALAIPEVMGYTKISGTPVITGLYTIVIPMALFALLGSSRHLVVGADSATAAMLAASLAGIAVVGSEEYVALAGLLAAMAAGFLFLARLLRLGFLADFLSRTVLVGFLTGVGIQVSLGQISGMLGLAGGGHGPIGKLMTDWREIDAVNYYAFALSVGVLVFIVLVKRISGRVPGALLALIGAIVVSWAFDLQAKGVQVLGTIPSGLPRLGIPDVEWSWALFERLIPTAFAMFIVILSQSAATSRAYAARYNERIDENTDLVGLGMANMGAALSGTFVVNGSPTKTQMVDSAGGRSQLASLVTVGIVVMVLLFLTAPLAYMPDAVLAAVVFLIGVELIDVRGLRRIYAERRVEFWVALITTGTVVFWGVEQGLLLAILLSLVAHTRLGYRPRNTVLTRADGGRWRMVPIECSEPILPGLLVYSFNHSLYYANAGQFSREVMALIGGAEEPLEWFCLECSAIDDIDYTAAAEMRSVCGSLSERKVRLVFTGLAPQVQAELEKSGIVKVAGADAIYPEVNDVITAFEHRRSS